MKLHSKIFLILIVFALFFTACAKTEKPTEQNTEAVIHDFEPVTDVQDGRYNVYVVLKVLTSQYWQDIVSGVKDAGNDLGCNVYVGGPEGEGDWQSQKELLEKAVNELGADAIILAPASSSGLAETTNSIYEKKIPIILVDTIINSQSFDTCYMTDNLQAGEYAAQEMIRQLKANGVDEDEKASIAIQITSTSSQTVIDRLAGFNQYWAANAPESWSVLDEVKLNDGDKDRAKQNCIDFISQYGDLKGMFGCNNSSTVGFVNGIVEKEAYNIALVGFDYADETAALIANEKAHVSTIVQNQYVMGYNGLKNTVEMLDGKPNEYKFIDTGTVVINRENQKEYEESKAGGEK